MHETALYRKYRPQNFKDVIGQDHIVNVLESSIKQGTIAHAYLFAGSRGIGKTSVARILARAIGTSENDLYEIDAASNRGIDDIREIRDGVNVLPFESKYKVYIIDEVHMLTKEAFNALLKTLEEPPAHAVFILATTETDKLPETVVSRCQVFTFRKPTLKILKDTVVTIAKKEGYSLEPSSAELIALLGDGSFRDTLGIVQKVIGSTGLATSSSSKEKKISAEDVEVVVGAPRSSLINDFISGLNVKDANSSLKALNSISKMGIDMGIFSRLVLAKLRSILLLRLSPDMKKDLEQDFSDEDFAFITSLATSKDSAINSKTILEFLKAQELARLSPIPELPLELAVAALVGQNVEGK